MEAWNKFVPDKREAEDIRRQIRQMAASYTPEWNFTQDSPDTGSVIGLIFANQMADNIKQYNDTMERIRTEFANMLGISLRPAIAAQSIVILNAGSNNITGIQVEKGTKLTAMAEQGEELIFETMHDLAVSGNHITDIIGISPKQNRITAYKGNLQAISLIPQLETALTADNIWQQALILYHRYLFDREEEKLEIRFSGNKNRENLAELFADHTRYEFLYYSADGLLPVETVQWHNDRVILRRKKASSHVIYKGGNYAPIIIRQLMADEGIELKRIELFAEDCSLLADYISDGSTDYEVKDFYPFGKEIALYQECYIGQEAVFSQRGSHVTLRFTLDFEERNFSLHQEEAEEKLPVIKRKPRYQQNMIPYLCMVQEVIFEYFNGAGWKRIALPPNMTGLFSNRELTGEQSITFLVPFDWQPVQTGGNQGKCLRIKTLRADNCYLRPARHVYPVIKDLTINYSYGGRAMEPDALVRLTGTKYTDLTKPFQMGNGVMAFQCFPFRENGLYFGFDEKFITGPISLFLKLQEKSYRQKGKIYWEYSTINGFKALKLTDNTDNLTNSGTILFEPPSDMGRMEIEGVARYWIRMENRDGMLDILSSYHDFIQDILPNAVMVHNVETSRPEEYYINTVQADMSFPLYGENILSVEVWVNERDELSVKQMEEMLGDEAYCVRAEYNFLGQIEEFYVRWTETDSFDTSIQTDRHFLVDRMNNRILFGDGIHVKIPRNTTDTSFYVIRHSCRGSLGNVKPDRIHAFAGNMLFIEKVYNPVEGYGGSNLESMKDALRRSSNRISSRKRLVSEHDYIREVMSFSENVIQAACICGVNRFGQKKERSITIVVLMKDYKSGSYSFRKLKQEFKKYLTDCCEMSIDESEIHIEEPIFMHISLDIWLWADGITDAITIRREWLEKIEQYFEPGHSTNGGWKIGNIPKEGQIRMMLHMLEKECHVEKYSITAFYYDHAGRHEMVVSEAAGNPFLVCCNGEHHIYINGGIHDVDQQ